MYCSRTHTHTCGTGWCERVGGASVQETEREAMNRTRAFITPTVRQFAKAPQHRHLREEIIWTKMTFSETINILSNNIFTKSFSLVTVGIFENISSDADKCQVTSLSLTRAGRKLQSFNLTVCRRCLVDGVYRGNGLRVDVQLCGFVHTTLEATCSSLSRLLVEPPAKWPEGTEMKSDLCCVALMVSN